VKHGPPGLCAKNPPATDLTLYHEARYIDLGLLDLEYKLSAAQRPIFDTQ